MVREQFFRSRLDELVRFDVYVNRYVPRSRECLHAFTIQLLETNFGPYRFNTYLLFVTVQLIFFLVCFFSPGFRARTISVLVEKIRQQCDIVCAISSLFRFRSSSCSRFCSNAGQSKANRWSRRCLARNYSISSRDTPGAEIFY